LAQNQGFTAMTLQCLKRCLYPNSWWCIFSKFIGGEDQSYLRKLSSYL
jgi:hypothetical protein